eukprot:TRINITY_DN27885_c0_g1_i1.p1 TRINITY_DN27885_c0_g1~~TRINITY_DN27885_c0_g1_i1.p1  ORF type:complete len:557 (+),score=140.78 TRINITY_DN27885_c0_g1_i1:58-1671(+)
MSATNVCDEKAEEILTVSLGPFSGIVNTHFWNSTSDHDAKLNVLYQQPNTGRGKAAPRLVVADWSGEMAVKRKWKLRDGISGDDIMTTPEEQEDDDDEPMEEEDTTPKLRTERWWSYMVTPLHDRSLNLISERFARDHSHHNAFGEGYAAWKDQSYSEHLQDNIRYFFEGMDKCQGINLSCDASGIFGGLAHSLITDIKDDYGRVPIWCNALFDQNNDEADGYVAQPNEPTDFEALKRWERQGVNRALSHTLLSETADGYLPIDVPSWSKMGGRTPGWRTKPNALNFEVNNSVEVGAIASAGISTALSPLFTGDMSLAHFCDVLRPVPSMRLSCLQTAMPMKLSMAAEGLHMQNVLQATTFDEYLPLSHGWPTDERGVKIFGTSTTHTMSQIFTARGISALPKTENVSHKQVSNEYWSEQLRTGRTQSAFTSPFLLSSTFPASLIPSGLNVIGWQDPEAPAEYTDTTIPTQLPVASHLSTTCASALMIHSINTRFKECHKALHLDQNIEIDQWKEAQEALEAMVDEYDQGLIDTDEF